jgi:hypothetical protein
LCSRWNSIITRFNVVRFSSCLLTWGAAGRGSGDDVCDGPERTLAGDVRLLAAPAPVGPSHRPMHQLLEGAPQVHLP